MATVKVVVVDVEDDGDVSCAPHGGALQRCRSAFDDGVYRPCDGPNDRGGFSPVVATRAETTMTELVTDLEAPTEAEIAEGRRVLALYPEGPPLEGYTCFDCVGRRLKSASTEDERASWADHARFGGSNVKTLCSLAWDQYNTDGDSLASKVGFCRRGNALFSIFSCSDSHTRRSQVSSALV